MLVSLQTPKPSKHRDQVRVSETYRKNRLQLAGGGENSRRKTPIRGGRRLPASSLRQQAEGVWRSPGSWRRVQRQQPTVATDVQQRGEEKAAGEGLLGSDCGRRGRSPASLAVAGKLEKNAAVVAEFERLEGCGARVALGKDSRRRNLGGNGFAKKPDGFMQFEENTTSPLLFGQTYT